MRKLRSTFLLRCVILAASIGIFLVVFLFSRSMGLTIATIVPLILFWIFGVELGLLPLLLEQILAKGAKASTKPVNSLWFVDVDQERKAAFDAHVESTSDNPTVR